MRDNILLALVLFMLIMISLALIGGVSYYAVKLALSEDEFSPEEINNTTQDYIRVINTQATHVVLHENIADYLLEEGLIDNYGELVGYSMQPTIFEGNTILSYNVTQETLITPGMIIRYTTFNTPTCIAVQTDMIPIEHIIHRVLATYDEYIVVMGDNNKQYEVINRCQVKNIIVGVLYT